MITRQKILQLLNDTESHRVERTTSKTNMDKFCQAICAFANDVSGSGENGYLMIGAEDSGELSGLYPYWATREILMNAIMHRDYDSNAPIQFYEYDDRIEIQNPGGLYGKVSPANFPNVSDYRNPFIAEAMKVLGYVNRFSRGVYRVQKELKENGNGEAVFDFSLRTAFRVVENISAKYFEGGFGADTEENIQETSKKHPRNVQENIIEAIKNNPNITRKDLEIKLGYSLGTIKYHLAQLVKNGVLRHEGATKAGKWIINNKL